MLKEEFREINPNCQIIFMPMKDFQNLASYNLNMYEENVYISLNRDDEFYINQVCKEVIQEIERSIIDAGYDYFESNELGLDELRDIEILCCDYLDTLNVEESNEGKKNYFTYTLEFRVEASCTSYEYYGRDEDTKEPIFSGGKQLSFK